MVQAAVLSLPAESGLEPHLLFDGPECDLTRWFRAQGGEVIFRESFMKAQLRAASADPQTPFASAHGNGVYLRAEIPALARERGWADNVVLYTDNDILFTPRFRAADLPIPTRPIAVAPEADRSDRIIFNSGVMLFNLELWRPIEMRFREFLNQDLPNALRGDWDQFSIRSFFGQDYHPLDPMWNWKPYWGENSEARVIHFHGPKPFLREAIRNNTALPVQIALANDTFWRACDTFDRLLASAGLSPA